MNWMYRFLSVLVVTFATTTTANAGWLDIAHRGYATDNPESTLRAFKQAHEQGADGIEFDVRQTSDGVLVVTHDVSIPALGNRFVSNIVFSDIYLETEIPSLEEVLIFAKEVDQTIWIEIKQSHLYPNIIQNVLGLITEYGLEQNTVIQSFNHQDLNTIKQIQPDIQLLALFSSNYTLSRVPVAANYVGLPISSQYQNANLVGRLHAVGKKVIFWRTNEISETKQSLRGFIDIGADGFMLDRSLKRIIAD